MGVLEEHTAVKRDGASAIGKPPTRRVIETR